MYLLLLVSALAAGALCAPASNNTRAYTHHQLISVRPTSEADVNLVRNLTTSNDLALDFWTQKITVDTDTLVRVRPEHSQALTAILKANHIKYTVLVDDLQAYLETDSEINEIESRGVSRNKEESGAFSFSRFLRYEEIEKGLLALRERYPDVVTLESMGKTNEGREMHVCKLSKSGGQAPRAVLVDAGIHAREWLAPAMALYLIHEIVENENVDMLDGLDWYIMPLFNPDGYEYTHTTERFWRKNRGKCSKSSCCGTDLNRNFDLHWMETGASSNHCSDTYAGSSAFSEIESQNFRDFVLKENHDSRIKMYLTLHSYGWYILYPWGFTSDLPADEKELRDIANEADNAMVQAGSQHYTIGTSTNVLYAAAGGSDDWAKGVAKIEKSFTIELPGGGGQGFDISPSKIKSSGKQVIEGLKAFANRAKTL